MNKVEAISWKTFKDTLSQHPDLDLQFQYAEGKLVDAAYHITEIKQAPITSVDCGGVMNAWTEIIVQLWVPENAEQQERSMKVGKALSIVDIVEKMLPLNPNGTVKIEFGNSAFDTRQMFPNEMIIDGNALTVDLRPDAVQCKAIGRGGSCGTTEKGEECCTPAVVEKPKVQLVNLAAPAEACCTPGGGGC
ncbi:hypothetical protein DIU31_022265 [Mucilaginibacter rubeus]|uniref:Uncharacterized protein n=2 Tax=Mucilaginibacter rubeus TaxID=2027860 RepID=A0A364WWE3_9SPHI|nr:MULTISPECIES: DUF6428 family protein [Mucilaginibacter]QEM06103.1 hypothetical protein DIU31_022265 [Mucilaginibacter rubeus]QEM13620.1 hypothetical protein DEO27_027620 [Mucilaginibacter rubeus]QEM18683.1 hypothetical protein DIU38_022490 [Mucilaginibacter gossypii]QTE36322.1 DUF6428 family protein [Mucilaginibacter gossypii]QTE44775.1 hypothetical protein J3L19_05230 [Mucilaginibacter rubeus]